MCCVEHDKCEGPREVLYDLVCWIGPTVSEGPVCLYDQHGFIGGSTAQTILSDQAAQIVESPGEHTVYVLEPAKQPAYVEFKII